MRYIKSFNELKTLSKKVSRSKNSKRRFVDTIFDDPSDSKSPSSGLLLRDELQNQQFIDILSGIDSEKVKDHLSKILETDGIDVALLSANNFKFLSDMRKKKGDLYCEYCKRGPLIYKDEIDTPSVKWFATCDHKQPIDLGGDKFSYSNLAICCLECNYAKANMPYSDWIENLPFYLDQRSGLIKKSKKFNSYGSRQR